MLFKTLLPLIALWAVMSTGEPKTPDELPKDNDCCHYLKKETETLRNTLGALVRQVMLMQMAKEERIRSYGHSGVKQVRYQNGGTKPYHFSTSSSAKKVMAIHDHSNHISTPGLGEFIAVLNGVEFRTRHNDYKLKMPIKSGKEYHKTVQIPFPDVPPEVISKQTHDEQIKEMREWFKAWKDQDHSVRDYRPYFKPVLCYLEGAWTTSTKDIEEPFDSDRHFLDASSWFDLQEKVRFTSYTGRKDNLENFSFLPTTIIDIINSTIPVFAQWNYRILCHPLKANLPLNRFRVLNDLQPRMASEKPMWEYVNGRAARFQLNPYDTDNWKDGPVKWGLLDRLMGEIPGKDNYPGNLTDDAFDLTAYSMDPGKPGKLNAAFYHRWFKVMEKGAMGVSTRHRGYADENLFVAMTTQPQVAGISLKRCKNKKCKEVHQKFSYAIPLEIIYMTPLSKWNPFDIEYKGDARSSLGKTVNANGRNGGRLPNTAYDGANSKVFYLTPSAFFTGEEVSTDAADTTKNTVGVLDKDGNVRTTRASGPRVFFPKIDGVGILRQRYPIMPVHDHGSSVSKELEATKEILMKSNTYSYMFFQSVGCCGPVPTEPPKKPMRMSTGYATKDPKGPHKHQFTLTADEVERAKERKSITKETETASQHEHTLKIRYIERIGKAPFWKIDSCDGADKILSRCWDHHPFRLDVIPDA